MTDYSSILNEASFPQVITQLCNQNGWKVTKLNDTMAMLGFNMESGRSYQVYIVKYGAMLEFSVSSNLILDNEDSIPHLISTALLKSNSKLGIGAWAIETIQNKYVYSLMHNTPIKLIDKGYFGAIVMNLVQECDKFDDALADMLRRIK